MKTHPIATPLIILLILLSHATFAQPSPTEHARTSFPTQPFVRWWWNGNKIEKAEIIRQLDLLHQAGIGGVEINPIEFPAKRCDSVGIPSQTLLSDRWLDLLHTALSHAKQIGMPCDLLVGSGWPFGSEDLPMNQRAQVVLTYSTPFTLRGDALYIPSPDGQTGTDTSQVLTLSHIFQAVDPAVTVPNPDRQFELLGLWLCPDTLSRIDQMLPLPIPASDTLTATPGSYVSPTGVPCTRLYALVRCRSFASVINGAPGASGPILDHLNRQAVSQYLTHFSTALQRRLGPMSQWLRAYFADSMELEGSNWTDDFAAEFLRRQGYDLMPWLPLILFKTGRLGEVTDYNYGAHKTPQFQQQLAHVRHHYELVKAQLLHERYTLTFVDWCHSQGVQARAQAYGRGFFPLQSSLPYDIPEGESWTTNYLRHRIGEEMPDSDYRRGRAYTMINKLVSSAAHQSGRRLVSAEEMTNTYRLFETTLELLKLGSDMSAISGTTHSVWHGFNYSPPAAGFPGWVQYGSYLNPQNTWWPYFHLLNEYRSRTAAILQNADMQTDIAILLPTDSLWAHYGVQTEPFPNYPKGSPYDIPYLLWEAVHKNGGNCDFVTRSQLDTAIIQNGKLIVGCKAYTALLVTPPNTSDSTLASLNTRLPVILVPDLTDRNYLGWYRTAQQTLRLPHAVTIADPDPFLLQNHYRNDRADDIFLFVNARLRGATASLISFPVEIYRHRTARVYNAATDSKQPLQLEKGSAWLYLPPAESLFIHD
ncbi:MAG: glycoside hydrolase family 2 [Bacteroidales bacterium]|nr:glycoside hydrolase family 2 [Bacteroidales bacterium]